MSYIVASMMKMKSANLIGIGNHNQRRFANHSNAEIDTERSHLNYDLVNRDKPINYKTDIENYINENKSSSKAVRKDAVLVNEWLITSDKAFFENMKNHEKEKFFQAAVDYFAEKFGRENIRYAQVHMDETTPHMHMGKVPIDKEKKSSTKRLFNREALIKIQDELPVYLNTRGFALERGERDSKRGHLSVDEFKEYADAKKEFEKEIQDLQATKQKLEDTIKKQTPKLTYTKKLNELLKALEGDLKPTLLGNRVSLPKDTYKTLIEALKSNLKREEGFMKELSALRENIKAWEKKYTDLLEREKEKNMPSFTLKEIQNKNQQMKKEQIKLREKETENDLKNAPKKSL